MSEKRFVLIEDDLEPLILDNKETMSVNEVADLLNEQQATISALQTENNHLIDVIKEYANKYEEQQSTINKLQEENEQLKNKLNKGL